MEDHKYSVFDIAKELDISEQIIYKHTKDFGIKVGRKKRYSKEDIEKIKAKLNRKKTPEGYIRATKVKEILSCSITKINKLIKEGELKSIRISNKIRVIEKESIKNYLNKQIKNNAKIIKGVK